MIKDIEKYNKTACDRDRFIKNMGIDIVVQGTKGNYLFLKTIHSLLVKAESILEIGTGTGTVPLWLGSLGRKMICVDFSSNLIKIAKNNCREFSNVEFKMANLNNLPFNKEHFDLVIKRLAPDNFFEINRVLKKEKDFVNFSDCENDGLEIKKIFKFPKNRTANSIKKELLNHKFSIIFEKEFIYKEKYNDFGQFIKMLEIAPLIPDFLDKQCYYEKKLETFFINNNFVLTRHKHLIHAKKKILRF